MTFARGSPPAAAAPSRREPTVFLLLVAAALVTRLWALGRVGLNHFDEGSYATAAARIAAGDVLGGMFPDASLRLPPLYILVAGGVMALLDTTVEQALVGTSIVCGVLTVLLVGRVGRAWYGAAAGASAALLVALSDFHVLYSRMALTDVLFGLLFLAAVVAYDRAQRRESLGLALLAGALVGLAWNAKYHGFLAAAVAGLALLPAFWRADAAARRGILARFVASVGVAVLFYLPWALLVNRQPGGYGQLTADNVNFLSAAANAFGHVKVHVLKQMFSDGWLSRAGPVLALGVAALLGGERRAGWPLRLGLSAAALLALGAAFTGFAVLCALAAAGLVGVLRRRPPGWTFHLGLFLAFLVLTPLYRPYARLLLPWLLATWLFAGVGLADLADAVLRGAAPRRTLVLASAGLALAGLAVALRGPAESGRTYAASDGFEAAAQQLAELLPPGEPVLVLGEPQLCLYLRRLGIEAESQLLPAVIERVERGQPATVVAGLYSRRRGLFEVWLEEPGRSHRSLGRVNPEVNEVRLLDDFHPWAARRIRRTPQDELALDVYAIEGDGR